MRRSIRILLALGVTLPVLACGDKDDAATDTSPRTLDQAQLNGTWIGACRAEGGVYKQSEWTFAGNTFTYALTEYFDADCTSKDNEIFGRGVFKLGEPSGDEGVVATYELATLTRSFHVDPERAASFAEACGVIGHAGGVVDVLGKDCAADAGFALASSHGEMSLREGRLYVADEQLTKAE